MAETQPEGKKLLFKARAASSSSHPKKRIFALTWRQKSGPFWAMPSAFGQVPGNWQTGVDCVQGFVPDVLTSAFWLNSAEKHPSNLKNSVELI